MKKKIIIPILITIAIVSGFFYFRAQVYFSHGPGKDKKIFEIAKGDSGSEIADNLKDAGLISGKWYFHYYVRTHGLASKFLPGEYELSGNMTIPEIAVYITEERNILPGYVTITFPEGWTLKKMAERLDNSGLDGRGFLEAAQDPQNFRKDYDFLGGAGSLEGYMFPDTYFFSRNIGPEDIIRKILDNFGKKIDSAMREEIRRQGKTLNEIIIMASLIEKEVQKEEDKFIVSGIFWNRLAIGQALQSDASLTYIFDNKTDQHSVEQTKVDSPYNTYMNPGLPIGPVSNPGMVAIEAAIYPKKTDYYYFFTAENETVFSRTFEEHTANRFKYGI